MEEQFTRVENDAVTSRGRRSLLKGAAWSVPAVAVAAAAPMAAASTTTPTCPTCIQPGVLGATTAQAVVLGNRGALVLAGGLGLNASNCSLTLFQPAYTTLVTGATLTMSNGATYPATLGVVAGAGTFGQIAALPGALTFTGIPFPNGTYGANAGQNQLRPTKVSVSLNVVFVGLPSLISISCPVTLTWDLNLLATISVVTLGAGTVNYTGTVSPA